jgi:hypothetical protein
MRGNKILIVVSAAAAIGVLGVSSAALAGDSGENNEGGAVMPGSMVGVNPVYHPEWFGRAASARSAYGYAIPEHKVRRTSEPRNR